MKIAFLNPFQNAAENQVFESLAVAAQKIGHCLVHCSNSTEVASEAPEFVLAMVSTQPKLNDIPHYAIVHEPRALFLTERNRYNNLLTRDGYLTISGSLTRFIRDLTFAVGRPQDPGFFFTTCQRQELTTDVLGLAATSRLRITYLGTNWDRERAELVRQLSRHDGVVVYGPEDSWLDLDAKSRGGPLPFDGDSVQRKYAENGIGLCLLSDMHYRDDVVSNRVFEVASVGAIAICPDTPWHRRHFGDTVYYIDQWLPRRQLVQQILLRLREIYRDPAGAAEKACGARKIFEERFAAEILLANAVEYHRQESEKRKTVLAAVAPTAPLISVIMRCGSRPIEMIRRAVQSLSSQSYGRFDVILVRHREMDLSPLTEASFPSIESIRVVESPAGKRSTSLWAGLSEVKGDYFSVLDDDDWLFSTHFETLFRPFECAPRKGFFAFSGTVQNEASSDGRGDAECRRLVNFGITETGSLEGISSAFTSNCFVASRDLLGEILWDDPELVTAEDSYLILSLLERARNPRFSYAATAVYECGRKDQSQFSTDPFRFEDELTVLVRMHAHHRPKLNVVDGYQALSQFWKQQSAANGTVAAFGVTPPSLKTAPSILSALPAELVDRVAISLNTERSVIHPGSEVLDGTTCECIVEPPPQPWAYGVELALNLSQARRGPCLIRVQVMVKSGPVGVGVLNRAETDFLFRVPLEQSGEIQEVHLPVADVKKMGRLVVQNWETPGDHAAHIRVLDVVTERLDKSFE